MLYRLNDPSFCEAGTILDAVRGRDGGVQTVSMLSLFFFVCVSSILAEVISFSVGHVNKNAYVRLCRISFTNVVGAANSSLQSASSCPAV